MVVADTLAPTIRPLFTEGEDLTKTATLRFHVGDNFSGITTWTLRIDGEWVPCDRFPMKGTLVHTFDTPATRRRAYGRTHGPRRMREYGALQWGSFTGRFRKGPAAETKNKRLNRMIQPLW